MSRKVMGRHSARTVSVVAIVATAAAVGLPAMANADPLSGANSTPGTLTCPALGLFQASTSGSPAARAVQIVGSSEVFVFKGSPDWNFYQGTGSSSKWVTCTLVEPGPGGVGSITVVGLLTPMTQGPQS
jgi:hypothetical protein